jgi:hypothetical protein
MSDRNAGYLVFIYSIFCAECVNSFLVPSLIAWSIFNCRPMAGLFVIFFAHLDVPWFPVVFFLPVTTMPLRLTFNFKEYLQFSTSAYLAEMQ